MRKFTLVFVIALSFGMALAQPANAPPERKQRIEAAWAKIESAKPATVEANNSVVTGTIPEPKLKAMSASLEKQFGFAVKGLQFESNDPPWTGKLTVFVFGDRSEYRTYCRSVEKRPFGEEEGFLEAAGDWPRLIVTVASEKNGPTVEQTANRFLAEALIVRRSGGVKPPDWFIEGFQKATLAQAAPGTASPKRLARKLQMPASFAWKDGVPKPQQDILWHSLAEFVTYGRGAPNLRALLEGFKPPMGSMDIPTFDKVLEAIKITPQELDKSYLQWLAKP